MTTMTGMGLIFVSIAFLVVPGVLYNNLNNSGLVVSQSLTCPGWPDVTCQGALNVGCQITPNNCNLSGSTISVLNTNSPFTQLIQGNVLGLFNQITTGSAAVGHGPFDSVGQSNYFTANCVVYATSSKNLGLQQYLFYSCTQINSDGSNTTKASATGWNNYNANFNGTTISLPFYHLNSTITNGGHAMSCNFQMQLNYTYASAAYAGWTYYGCDIWNPPAHTGCSQEIPSTVSCLTKQYYWSFLVSIPWQQGVLTSAKDYACTSVGVGDFCWHIQANIQVEQWDTEECLPIVPSDVIHQSPQCAQWFSNYKAQVQAGSGGSPVSFGAFTPIVTFLIGVIFFFMGLGINFTMGGSILGSGTTFGAGSNRQGTKLFQVLGLGLLVWSIFYSEFSTWFTSSLLPYGFDGATGIISVLLTGLFFFGVYEWATTG